MVFKLRKKDPTRHVLKTKLSFKSFRTYLRECVVLLLCWNPLIMKSEVYRSCVSVLMFRVAA